jgi:hypothetical protein
MEAEELTAVQEKGHFPERMLPIAFRPVTFTAG